MLQSHVGDVYKRQETTLVETAAYSDKISYLAIDLESEDGIRTIIRTVGERYGRLDILSIMPDGHPSPRLQR